MASPAFAKLAERRGLWLDSLSINDPYFDAAAARAAGMDGAVVDLVIYPRNRASARDALESWRRTSIQTEAGYRIVTRAADIPAARAAGLFAVILACQDAQILDAAMYSVSDENLDNLEEFHASGLRVLQLTHNDSNGLGGSFQAEVDPGLSRYGRAVVERMGALGMLVDLSHCGDRTTADAIAASNRPVAVTHAGCRALHPSKRNKTDASIRALADKGGYFGVYMMTRWLTDAPTASVATVADHIDHAVKVGGIDVVGFGSDQSIAGDPTPQARKIEQLARYQARNLGVAGAEPLHGHVTAADMDKPDRMRVLAAELQRRGYRGDRLDKVMGGNFIRCFSATCG